MNIIRNFLRDNRFRQNVFIPAEYSISFNRQVSKSINIELPAEQDIVDRIRAGESDE